MRSAPLTDDRGRPARLCRLCDLPADAPASAKAAVRAADAQHGRGLAITLAITCPAPLAASLVVSIWRTGSIGVWLNLYAAGIVSVSGVVGLTIGHVMHSRRLRREARLACLQAGLCPACGYELIPSPPEPDGCTICPECGAAWS